MRHIGHWICNCEEGFIYHTAVRACFFCGMKSPFFTYKRPPKISEGTVERRRRNRDWLVLLYGGMTIFEIAQQYKTYPQKIRAGIKSASKLVV